VGLCAVRKVQSGYQPSLKYPEIKTTWLLPGYHTYPDVSPTEMSGPFVSQAPAVLMDIICPRRDIHVQPFAPPTQLFAERGSLIGQKAMKRWSQSMYMTCLDIAIQLFFQLPSNITLTI
jgi:hypothetical protein